MKFRVSGRTLLFFAGCVWLMAGTNILRIGIYEWLTHSQHLLRESCEAVIVFLLFFHLVFKRLYDKHSKRIEMKEGERCPFSFFDVKGWIVMAIMMTFGILARHYHLFSDRFIAVFYTGLSSALITTSLLFFRRWWKDQIR